MTELSPADQETVTEKPKPAAMSQIIEAAPSPALSFSKPADVRASFVFRHRGLLGALVLGPMAFITLFSRTVGAESHSLAWALNAAGWMLFLLYAGVRVWATLFIGGHKDRELQTEGPYSVCRNPLYVGSLFFALSAACFLKSATFAAAVLVAFLIYLQLVVRAEERFLQLRFGGEYRRYCAGTPRFWPRWTAFRSPPQVPVELRRLRLECVRLARAALVPISLQLLMPLVTSPSWPHWFHLP